MVQPKPYCLLFALLFLALFVKRVAKEHPLTFGHYAFHDANVTSCRMKVNNYFQKSSFV
jgi:hypothetical protein